jgi:hypothetical protein
MRVIYVYLYRFKVLSPELYSSRLLIAFVVFVVFVVVVNYSTAVILILSLPRILTTHTPPYSAVYIRFPAFSPP